MRYDVAVSFPGQWELLERVRSEVRACLPPTAPAERDACVMAASELTENALKYGEPTPSCPRAEFRLSVQDRVVQIEIENGIAEGLHATRLRERVAKIEQTQDKLALYVERLQEIVDSDERIKSAGLGLYRVAAEGGFDLTCACFPRHVKLTARRKLGGPL